MGSAVPVIEDDTLAELSARIRPVMFGDDEDLYYIEPVDPRRIAFAWSPVLADRADHLRPLTEIVTIHYYGAPAFFKPTIAEVLAQIPTDLLPTVVAFHTEIDSDQQFTPDGGHHRAITTLYTEYGQDSTSA